MKNKFLVLIPVYNEESVIKKVYLDTKPLIHSWADLIFVNDGSTDNSKNILDEIQFQNPDVFVFHKEKNSGYGSSLIYGFDLSIEKKYDFIITMDCDEQHQPKDLIRFKNFDLEVDVLSGSRYKEESNSIGIKPPKDRVEINRRITSMLNKKYNWNLTDSFCGFKRFKVGKLKKGIFSEYGYSFPLEFWSYAKYSNLSIQELAVDKIYITDDRSFGEDLDRKRKRYKYYLESFYRAEKKFKHLSNP